MFDGAPHHLEIGQRLFKVLAVAAREDGERRLARSFVAAGDGGVKDADAAFFARGLYLSR